MSKSPWTMVAIVLMVSTAAAGSPWTPEVSVAMTYFATPEGAYGEENVTGARPVFSPDGRRFFVIVRRGDLERDCNVYELKVFATESVRAAVAAQRAAPSPEVWSTCSRDSLEAGISSVRWTEDSATLVFLEARENAPRQVVLWQPGSQQSASLTHAEFNVESFDYRSGAVVYVAAVNTGKRADWSAYPASYIRGPELTAALGFGTPSYVTFVRAPGSEAQPVSSPQSGDWRRMGFLSPDGKKAVIVGFPDQAPASWSQYKNSAGRSFGNYAQYRIVDVRTGESRPIVEAPLGHAIDNHTRPQVLWAADSKRVILVNTLLPIVDGAEERIHTSYVVDYDVANDESRIVAAMPAESVDRIRKGFAPVMDASWLKRGRELLLAGMAPSVVYKLEQGRWIARAYKESTPSKAMHGLDVSIRQGLNQPPELIAKQGRRELSLLSNDAALEEVSRAPVEQVEWQDRRGGVWKAHLVMPASSGSEPVPVILQAASHLYPSQFFPDGALSAGFAAQALASRGFAVLTFGVIGQGHDRIGPEEGADFVAGVDSAVAFLRERIPNGLGRVGLIGFSRSGYLINYAISHPGDAKLGAAVIQDSADASYVQYLLDGALKTSLRDQYEGQYEGGGSFWDNRSAWMSGAPGFNPDRVNVPLLLTRHGGSVGGLVTVLESYAGLRMNRRPVELRILPEASHPLLRPGHRLAAMHGVIDWMRFWLLDQADTDPAKASQYQHWRELRQEWRE